MIEGGWEYIIVAYGITWLGLAIYGVRLYRQFYGSHESLGRHD